MKIGQKKLFFYIILWIITIHTNSCKNDFENFNWDTDITLPVAYGKLTLNNLLPDSILQNNGGNLSLNLEQELINVDIEKLISIPDTTIDTTYAFAFNLNFDPGLIYYNTTEKNKLSLSGAQITSAIMNKGKIVFKVSTTLKERSLITFKMPIATKNGQSLTFTDWIEKSDGNTPVNFSKEIDLSGYSLNLKGSTGNSYNEIYYQITAQTDPNGQSVIFEPKDFFKIETRFVNLAPEYVLGYFGKSTNNIGPESTTLNLFDKIKSGNLALSDATLNLSVINRIGADFKLKVKNISSYNTTNQSTVDLTNSELINNTITINRANQDNNGTYPPVTPFVRNFNLTNSNSNIKSFIENLPSKINYELSFELNPMGNLSGGNDFVFFNKPFEAKMILNVPLNFKLNNLVLADTLEFNNNVNGKENIKSGTASFYIKNNFPFSISLLLYTADSLGNTNSTPITAEQIIKSAETDANGNIIKESEQELVYFLNSVNLNNILSKGKIFLIAKANSPSSTNTIITDKCYIEYKHKIQVITNTAIIGKK